jgi:hypothetical protein
VARCHIVVVLHDVSMLADTYELRIVRAFHLRGAHADQPPQNLFACRLRIPVSRDDGDRVRGMQRGQRHEQQGGEE